MIRVIFTFLFLSITTASIAQVASDTNKGAHVELSGQIFNLPHDTLYISQYLGRRGYNNFDKAVADESGNFSFSADLPGEDYYVLRVGDRTHLNIILKDQDTIKVYGDGKNITFLSNVVGSEETERMNEFIQTSQVFQMQKDSISRAIQMNPQNRQILEQNFQQKYLQFTAARSRFTSTNRFSPALVAALPTFNMPKEFKNYEAVAKDLFECFPQSSVIKSVKGQLATYRAQYEASQTLASGNPAPEIKMPNTNGDTLKLSDLKGKVVLIDFWASWCGPCRRENPNVVKAYEKYKDDGFEIFSVSLDRDKAKWIAAIQQDKLTWDNHVSELNSFRNSAAQAYGVTGIPFTVLIDREGNIIDTKLRGMALESALSSIFGH